MSILRLILLIGLLFNLVACDSFSDLSLVSSPEPTPTLEPLADLDLEPTKEKPTVEVIQQMPSALTVEPTPLPAEVIAEADAEERLLISLYERVNPSVVNIFVTVEGANIAQNQLFPTQGQGSGFVYDAEGHIVTNNHVIHNAKRLDVTFHDGIIVPGEIIGTDPDSDLAVVKVNVPIESLRPVTWADSDKILVGQRAVAIGNPFGLKGSLTTGIISALDRSLPTSGRGFQIPEIIQTDAAINPGNSGGPLLDSHGDVLGVNTAIVPRQLGTGERSFLGVGFAVPSNLVQRVVPSLIETGEYKHPWLGIRAGNVTTEIAEKMSLPTSLGAFITEVISGSPADTAGLRSGTREVVMANGIDTRIGGDVIIEIDGEAVRSFDDVVSYLARKGEVDRTIDIVIIRDGEERTLELTIEARPTDEDLE